VTAFVWPDEPVRPVGALPDAPLMVLIRVTLPHNATRNIVASCSHGPRYLRDGQQQWFISRVEGCCSWDQIPERLGFDTWHRLGVKVFLLGVMDALS
jgi:hypothetical protein